MKRFNTAGTCRPNEHYMVDITERLEIIRKMKAALEHDYIKRVKTPVEIQIHYTKATSCPSASTRTSSQACCRQWSSTAAH